MPNIDNTLQNSMSRLCGDRDEKANYDRSKRDQNSVSLLRTLLC